MPWRRGGANSTASGRRVRQHRSFAPWRKARPEKCRGEPRPEPDSGNPTVRDRRGASGNVASGGHPPAARASDFYLDRSAVSPSHALASVRVLAKRWQGYVRAGLLSREINDSGCRRCPGRRKATSPAALCASRRRTPRGRGTCARAESPCARTGRSNVRSPVVVVGWAVRGTLRR
jgi:hypothetical protein